MPPTIIEDRVLARLAYEAAGRTDQADAPAGVDVALGQVVIALRVLGIAAGPEVLNTVRADLVEIFADPAKLARARTLVSDARRLRPANTNRAARLQSATG